MKTELIEKILEKYLLGDNDLKKDNELGSEFIGKYVILRGYDSGVHFGKLEKAIKGNYVLTNSRRLWYWECKKGLSLSSIAQYGLSDNSKITCTLAKIQITDERINEIIPCTDEAIKSIIEQKEYLPK